MSITRTQVNEALKALGLDGTKVVELRMTVHEIFITRYKRDHNDKLVLGADGYITHETDTQRVRDEE